MPRIPLIEELTTGSVLPGSVLLAEFTGVSQWYNASFTIAAGWLKSGGLVTYVAFGRSPENARLQLGRLGLKAEELESEGRLRIVDCYTCTLGRKSKEKISVDSLKAADLSILFSKTSMVGKLGTGEPVRQGMLEIEDNASTVFRFNDEKAVTEFVLSRFIPSMSLAKTNALVGIVKGLHSSWVYEQLEAAVDGTIEFVLDETADPPGNLVRIRSLRDVGFDGQWHRLKISDNFQVTLEK